MITRKLIRKAREKSRKFLINQQIKGEGASLYASTKYLLRSSDFFIRYDIAFRLLNNIKFFYNDIDQHWAETDGECILLNTFKNYDKREDLLVSTLIHESLHNIIYHNNRHLIPEEKEHKIMELILPTLISPEYRFY